MDNLTHSLIGTAMGDGIRRLPAFRDRSQKFLTAILWAAIIGNNIPDGDFIINRISTGGELGYLLHHRGYTHTLIAAPLLALVTMLLSAAIGRVRGLKGFSSAEWRALYWISLASVGLHIGADFMNDYGIHPFAPFWSHWVYGGVIYIVEPLILAALLPLWIFGFQSKITKAIGIAFSGLLLWLLWFAKITTWPVALASTLLLAASAWVQKKRPGPWVPILATLGVVLVFTYMGREVSARVRDQIAQEQPEELMTQLVTTPSPGNPFCWRVIPVTRLQMSGMTGQASGQIMTPFFERIGVVSLWPTLFPPESCAYGANVERTAPLMKSSLTSADGVYWVGEFRGTTESLFSAAAQYCRFAQFLKWSRVPFYFKTSEKTLLGGDLRYDQEKGLNFAKYEFQAEEPCLAHVPSWDSPAGLLQSGPQKTQ